MPASDSPYGPLFDNLARGSAHMMEAQWRRQGIAMPAGAAERFGQVVADYLRTRNDPLSETMVNIGMTRLLEIIHAAEKEVQGGKNDPAFLDVFAAKVRAEFEEYEPGDPAASA